MFFSLDIGSLILGVATAAIAWNTHKLNKNLNRALPEIVRLTDTLYLITNVGQISMFDIRFFFEEIEIAKTSEAISKNEPLKLILRWPEINIELFGIEKEMKEITMKYKDASSKDYKECSINLEQEIKKGTTVLGKEVKEVALKNEEVTNKIFEALNIKKEQK